MTGKTNTIRTASALFAAAALAALAAPAALADPPQGHRATGPADVVEPYVASGRGAGVDAAPIRPDDRAGARPVAISKSRPPISAVGADGFRWDDATIGAGVTAGVLLLAGALALTIRHRRRVALS